MAVAPVLEGGVQPLRVGGFEPWAQCQKSWEQVQRKAVQGQGHWTSRQGAPQPGPEAVPIVA